MNDEHQLPREKLETHGVQALSDEELIAVILRSGTKNASVFKASRDLMERYKDLITLADAGISDIASVQGIGRVRAINLKASLEIGKRYHLQKKKAGTHYKMDSPDNVYTFSEEMIHYDKEVVRVICLNSKLKVLGYEDISMGTVNHSLAHPRDIFRYAIRSNAVSIILVHNHPSGDPTPSMDDRELTEKIKQGGELLNIRMNDHLIMGKSSYYSFSLSRMVEMNV